MTQLHYGRQTFNYDTKIVVIFVDTALCVCIICNGAHNLTCVHCCSLLLSYQHYDLHVILIIVFKIVYCLFNLVSKLVCSIIRIHMFHNIFESKSAV